MSIGSTRSVRLTGELLIAKNAIGHSAERRAGRRRSRASSPSRSRTSTCCSNAWSANCSSRCSACGSCRCSTPSSASRASSARWPPSLGKPARLMIEGATTEADKTIVEAIAEPLLHVLRNGLDHGLEDAAERAALGKPATATIHLRAARQGEHVVDRGRGRRPRDRRGAGPRGRPRSATSAPAGRHRRHVRRGGRRPDLRARLLDRSPGHRPVGPRCRHGRRAHHDRAPGRAGLGVEPAGNAAPPCGSPCRSP